MSVKTDNTLEIIETINSPLFANVREYLYEALIIAWDGCHKIYFGMDAEQADWFRENYPHTEEGTRGDMLYTVATWWNQSCCLRFVQAVYTNHEDPNAGYETVIGQGEGEEDYDYEDDWDDEDQ